MKEKVHTGSDKPTDKTYPKNHILFTDFAGKTTFFNIFVCKYQLYFIPYYEKNLSFALVPAGIVPQHASVG